MNEAEPPIPMRVVFWGTYDLSKPRTRILRDGLRENGVEVIEIHTDVWSQFADKSQLGKLEMVKTLLNVVLSYPKLILRYLRAPAHDIVLVPYLGQFDVLVLWPFARLKRKPVVWDMFLSLYDTVINDRRMATKWSLAAIFLKGLEWLGCRAATKVLLDTHAHAQHITRLFSLPKNRADAVPVGAEPDVFARQTATPFHEGPTKILFYGQLIPLHGVETILKAAMSERGRPHAWRIIGKGQQSGFVEDMLADGNSPHIVREQWLAYDKLIAAIAQTDVCLGIFGSSEKAASVVPNKVYQCISAGRTVITRKSPAMTETFPTPNPGLLLIPDADAEALLDAIDLAIANNFPVMPADALKQARPRELGRKLCEDILTPLLNVARIQ